MFRLFKKKKPSDESTVEDVVENQSNALSNENTSDNSSTDAQSEIDANIETDPNQANKHSTVEYGGNSTYHKRPHPTLITE